jgi:predicted RNA-binding protein with RPS1 domain
MDSSVVEETVVEVKPKTPITGKVTKITLAGALVDLGEGKKGMLHISQIVSASEEEPVKRVEDVLKVGQEIDVWVRRERPDHLEVTMIKPLDLEWREIKKGMSVKGKVTRLEKFGAFVEIGAERPGLIHISELAHGYVRTPGDVVKEGDEVEAQVLDVNRRKKQIKLSLKALQPEPVKEEAPVQLGERPERKKVRGGGKKGPGRRSDRDSGYSGETMTFTDDTSEPDPTYMEIVLRQAMEKAKTRKQEDKEKARRAKNVSQEQEDLLTRTLEHKARNS